MTTQFISSTGEQKPQFATWDNTYGYNAGDLVFADGNVYIANATIAAGQPFTVGDTHFQLAVMGADSTSSISNGNSNVSIDTAGGDITLSSNGIANVMVVSANATVSLVEVDGNLTALNIDGGNLVSANYFTGNIINGNSNIVVTANGNITLSANGTADLFRVDADGNIYSEADEFNLNGNIKLNSLGQGVIFVGANANPSLTNYEVFVTAPNSNAFTANYTLTLPANAGSNLQFLQTDGNGAMTWADASIKVSLQEDSATKPEDPLSGDTLVVTDTGLYDGTVLEEWVYNGTDWVQVIGTPPVSNSILDNTIVDSDDATQIGTYIVPASDLVNAFVGHEDAYAAFDGSGFTFTAPTDGDVVLINSGVNAGQCWKFTTLGGWALTNGGVLSTYNWVLTNPYPAGSIVVYNSNLYQANGNIPANTAWAVGVTGATWKALSSGGAYQAQSFTATAGQTVFSLSQTPVGGVAMFVNGVMISATAVSVVGTTATYAKANNGNYTLTAGDVVTITYMYGTINTNLVNAVNGQNYGIIQTTIVGNSVPQLVGNSSFTISTAGTWDIEYSIYAHNSNDYGTQFELFNTTANTVVPNSFASTTWCGAAGVTGSTATGLARVTTTGSTTFAIYGAAGGGTTTIYNNYVGGNIGSTGNNSVLYGASGVRWKQISGFTPITGITSTTTQFGNIDATGTITGTSILAVPNWTSAGTITFGATTTAPTIGTIYANRNLVQYRKVGPKTYQVQMNYYQTAAGSAGSGDYLFTLPAGLSFDTTLVTQTVVSGVLGVSHAWQAQSLPSSIGTITDGTTMCPALGVVPYSATQFRIAATTYAGITAPWAAGGVHLGLANVQMRLQFEFQAA